MKNLLLYSRFAVVLLMTSAFSCKKSTQINNCCQFTRPIRFEIVDKNGNSVIQSVNDALLVTYTDNNGLLVTSHCDIFKVEKSLTDTTRTAKYNGYVFSDADPTMVNGSYLAEPSGGVGIRNFKFYLNSQLLGLVYFDYFSAYASINAPSISSFTINQTPATNDIITGVLAPGYPINVGAATNQYFTQVSDIPVFVLHLQ